jgi:hypothetical protein
MAALLRAQLTISKYFGSRTSGRGGTGTEIKVPAHTAELTATPAAGNPGDTGYKHGKRINRKRQRARKEDSDHRE